MNLWKFKNWEKQSQAQEYEYIKDIQKSKEDMTGEGMIPQYTVSAKITLNAHFPQITFVQKKIAPDAH